MCSKYLWIHYVSFMCYFIKIRGSRSNVYKNKTNILTIHKKQKQNLSTKKTNNDPCATGAIYPYDQFNNLNWVYSFFSCGRILNEDRCEGRCKFLSVTKINWRKRWAQSIKSFLSLRIKTFPRNHRGITYCIQNYIL